MTDEPPCVAELSEVRSVSLTEVDAPAPSPAHRLARDRLWDRAVEANPALFDGPVAACAQSLWHGQDLMLSWARVTYRHHALRRVPGASSLPSLFVNVLQRTTDGRMLVAQMSSSTATPCRWQLPGGSVEPPAAGQALDEAGVRSHAARELEEELGVPAAAGSLTLWVASTGKHGSVGLTFLAPPLPARELTDRFAAVTAAEKAAGREAELAALAFVGSVSELHALQGPHADYLRPVVRRFAAGVPRRA